MEPAIPIVSYLWEARHTWLKHDVNCECPFNELAEQVLNGLPVGLYSEIVELDEGPLQVYLQCTRAEWDALIGPEVQAAHTNELANALMAQATELMGRASFLSDLVRESHE